MSDTPHTGPLPFRVDLESAFMAMSCHTALMELDGTKIVVTHMEGYRGPGESRPEVQQIILRLEDWRQVAAMVERMLRRTGLGA